MYMKLKSSSQLCEQAALLELVKHFLFIYFIFFFFCLPYLSWSFFFSSFHLGSFWVRS